MALRQTIMREGDMVGSKSGRCSRRREFMSRRWGRRRRSERWSGAKVRRSWKIGGEAGCGQGREWSGAEGGGETVG